MQRFRPFSTNLEELQLKCSFAPAGTGAPTDLRGTGVTAVARTGVGTFQLTLDRQFAKLIYGSAHLQLSTGADQKAQLGDIDLANRTVDVRIWDISGAAEADVAADPNNRVMVELAFYSWVM